MNDLGYTGCVSPVYVVFRVEKGYHHFFNFFIKTPRFRKEVIARSSGTVRQVMNYDNFARIKLIYPAKEAIQEFNHIFTPFLKEMLFYEKESSNLEQLRDALLPKLLSGEIDVSKLDI